MHTIFKKREKIIFYITISLIAFSLVFNFFLSPLLGKYEALNKEVNINRLKLEKYLALLSQQKEIEDKYAKLSLSPEFVKDNSDHLVTALAALENLAKKADIKIVDMRPEATQKRNDQDAIELRAEGSMENYTKFIYDIENSLLLLKIKRFQLTAKPNAQSLDGSFTVIQSNILK
ncbi:MAG: hypothetical protein WCY05_06105 [Candidatus Omnitrophota bacterium]